ncbi:MAG TPA: alpha/beta hydrolase [Candidatus Acidoferrales bacterium]|nr:alpha/beta hydrolase [Candidatus Acidoferrales bacterium]
MPDANSYDVAGPPGSSVIVFVHGMRVTRKMWKPQMERLAGAYRVIALDLPGHGALKHVPFRLSDSVTRIAEVTAREAPNGRALIVGLSLGGYIAMEFGARYPQKAAGLVVASATVEPRGWHTIPYRILATLMDKLPERWLNWISRTFFQIVYPPEKAEPLIAPGFFMRGGAQGLREVFGRAFAPRLAAYPGPVLLLNGAFDLGFRMHERKFLAAAQHGRLEIIPRAFHLANIDQPDAFSNATRHFAESISW